MQIELSQSDVTTLKQETDAETARRRDQATLLRAKLIQAAARASEHEEVEHAN